jgi:hypothetical protein
MMYHSFPIPLRKLHEKRNAFIGVYASKHQKKELSTFSFLRDEQISKLSNITQSHYRAIGYLRILAILAKNNAYYRAIRILSNLAAEPAEVARYNAYYVNGPKPKNLDYGCVNH